MKNLSLLLALLATFGMVPAALANENHHHNQHDQEVQARLSGFNEVHFVTTTICVPGGTTALPCPEANIAVLNSAALRGAVSTAARGRFKAEIDKHDQRIDYELSFEGLEGTVTQAHIHFGQRHTVGGIVVWLCQTAAVPAPAAVADVNITPICPQQGTVTGTILPSQVLAVAGQGIAAGEFTELLRAIRAGITYANVHSTLFPPGEIRGQIHDRDHDHHGHKHGH